MLYISQNARESQWEDKRVGLRTVPSGTAVKMAVVTGTAYSSAQGSKSG